MPDPMSKGVLGPRSVRESAYTVYVHTHSHIHILKLTLSRISPGSATPGALRLKTDRGDRNSV